jgi:hypothetical protein
LTPQSHLESMEFLPMRSFTRASLALLLLSSPAAADDGKVIPLSPALKKDLALLGDGVVGKAVPAQAITDATRLMRAPTRCTRPPARSTRR